MDSIEQFLQGEFDDSRWYHGRRDARRSFDDAVLIELKEGSAISSAIQKVIIKMPKMESVIAKMSFEALIAYYGSLRRFEQELAIADNVRLISQMRKSRAQQKTSQGI